MRVNDGLTLPIRQNVAACAALGLSYWADHPDPGCVWAVDAANQEYRIVKIDRRNGEARDLALVGKNGVVPISGPEVVYVSFDALALKNRKELTL